MTTGKNNSLGLINEYVASLGANENFKDEVVSNSNADLTGNIRPADPGTRIGVPGGDYAIIDKLPPGWTAGSTGASPCIGVILVYPDGKIGVYHFQNPQNASSTMFQTKPDDYPTGTKALVFGGDNSDISNGTLRQVVGYLDTWKVGYQYSDSTGGNVDSDGNFFLRPNDDMKPGGGIK